LKHLRTPSNKLRSLHSPESQEGLKQSPVNALHQLIAMPPRISRRVETSSHVHVHPPIFRGPESQEGLKHIVEDFQRRPCYRRLSRISRRVETY